MRGSKKVGEVTFRFYQFPDGTWKVATVVHQKHLPDMDKEPRAYMKMAVMAAQVRDYVQKQMVALDTLLVGQEEMKTIMAHAKAKADVDRLQSKLPFETEEDIKRQEEADDWADNGFDDGED